MPDKLQLFLDNVHDQFVLWLPDKWPSNWHEGVVFLTDHVDLVFVFPILAIGIGLILRRAGLFSWPSRDIAYVVGCLSLAAGYCVAFSPTTETNGSRYFPILIVFFSPQVFVLAAMAGIAIARKCWNSSYRAPLWLLFVIGFLGHGWTKFMIGALVAKAGYPLP